MEKKTEPKEKFNLRMDLSSYEELLPKIPGNTMAAKIRYLIAYYERMEINYVAINGIQGVGKYYPQVRRRYSNMIDEFYSETGEDLQEYILIDESTD